MPVILTTSGSATVGPRGLRASLRVRRRDRHDAVRADAAEHLGQAVVVEQPAERREPGVRSAGITLVDGLQDARVPHLARDAARRAVRSAVPTSHATSSTDTTLTDAAGDASRQCAAGAR